MKSQMLFAVWGLLAVYASCTAVEPAEMAELAASEMAEEPLQIIETSEEINLDDVYTGPAPRTNVLLLRVITKRNAVKNTVLVHKITYTGKKTTKISSVRWWQLTSLNAGARILSGGAGTKAVTVEIRSAKGRGYHYQVELYGRH